MAIDFPVYQPPDVSGAFQKGKDDAVRNAEAPLTLANMLDEQKMSKLTLANAEKQAKDQEQIKSILKGVDYSSPEGLSKATAALSQGGYGAEAMNLMRFGQQYASGEHQQRLDKLEETSKQQGRIATELDIATAQLDAMKAAGADPKALDVQAAQIVDKVLPQLKQDHPDLGPQIDQWSKNPGLRTYAGLKKFEEISNQSSALLNKQIEAMRLSIEQQRYTTTAQQGAERLRQSQERIDDARKKGQLKTIQVQTGVDKSGKPVTETHYAIINPESGASEDTGLVAPARGAQQSAITARQITRMNQSAEEATSQLLTMSRLGGSTGFFKEAGSGIDGSMKGLFTGDVAKMQDAILSGLSQELVAARELGSSTQTDPQIAETLKGLKILPTDSIKVAQFKLATAARTLRNALDSVPELGNQKQQERAEELKRKLEVFPDPDVVAHAQPGDNLFPQNVPGYKPETPGAAAAGQKFSGGTPAPASRPAAAPAAPAATPAPRSSGAPQGMTFANQADLQSAIAAGKVKKGDRVTVGGQSGTIQ